jgi:hypothetical protein
VEAQVQANRRQQAAAAQKRENARSWRYFESKQVKCVAPGLTARDRAFITRPAAAAATAGAQQQQQKSAAATTTAAARKEKRDKYT